MAQFDMHFAAQFLLYICGTEKRLWRNGLVHWKGYLILPSLGRLSDQFCVIKYVEGLLYL